MKAKVNVVVGRGSNGLYSLRVEDAVSLGGSVTRYERCCLGMFLTWIGGAMVLLAIAVTL